MHHVELRSVEVPNERVMEAHVGDNDEVFEKREKCVDARFAKGVVTPVTVHRRDE